VLPNATVIAADKGALVFGIVIPAYTANLFIFIVVVIFFCLRRLYALLRRL
jgi:hypothetical protein